ncbi:MAG: hypothetical protein ACRDTF_24080, partial [Pseudonocardiaceae bacterium]
PWLTNRSASVSRLVSRSRSRTHARVVTIAQRLAVHCLIGVPLFFTWLRTGNLTAPVLAHTLIDAIRNGLQASL